LTLTKMNLPSTLFPSIDLAYIEDKYSDISRQRLFGSWSSTKGLKLKNDIPDPPYNYNDTKIWVSTNPRGAERLPPDIVTPESDFYLRRLWGDPNEVHKFESTCFYLRMASRSWHILLVWHAGFNSQAAVSSNIYGWL
jgi:hypothetical protein